MQQSSLELKFGNYADLHTVSGLKALDKDFLRHLATVDMGLVAFLQAYRDGQAFERSEWSNGLIACAEVFDDYLIRLFNIETEAKQLAEDTLRDNPIHWFKTHIVLKSAKRRLKEGSSRSFDELNAALQQWLNGKDAELSLATAAMTLADSDPQGAELENIIDWCVAVMTMDALPEALESWVSFRFPQKLDFSHLLDVESVEHHGIACLQADPQHFRQRHDFNLTDTGMTRREVMDQIHYCVYCHKNDGDFCATGFLQKKKQPELGFKTNPLNEILAGCPLDEKISEMQALKRDAFALGALAVVMIDNPMCPATGHRICNDCMKSCIYQRQTPVDIPQVETRVLRDVLGLPWGVEIYDLLTRWNPLRRQQYLPAEYNGNKVLVMGMGPAGFTLSHYLTMSGYAVVGMDGLKIEPVEEQWLSQPIRDFDSIYEPLSQRVVHGFGGVAEYGITVRWDKNFLKLIYISLMRRTLFRVYGGVRFGGTITVEKAWQLGFDHLAVAVGAGLPRELTIDNSLAPGMRQANDFLMALQLTGAAKADSLANLQVRLPAVVIGGGLTGVDTATEVQTYYLTQIAKIKRRYDKLCQMNGTDVVRQQFNQHDLLVLDEFLLHADEYDKCLQLAEQQGVEPDIIGLIRRFGGVTITYRRAMNQSPAYRKNHEELSKAMEEGIFYAEHLSPETVVLDEFGDCQRLAFTNQHGEIVHLPARSIFVATGAKPNVAYAFEHKNTFVRDRYEYQAYQDINGILQAIEHTEHTKVDDIGMFTSYDKQDKRVTFLGDTHPSFHGSVVKAIASAKRCYEAIDHQLAQQLNNNNEPIEHFFATIQQGLNSVVISNTELTAGVREIIVRSPIAASQYQPGQFYRLQNFETSAQQRLSTAFEMEGVACMASRVEGADDQLALLVFERGTSSRLTRYLEPEQSICLMGPTGVMTRLPDQPQTVLVIGSNMAIAYLRSLKELIADGGHKLIFIGDFQHEGEVICRDEMEALCSHIIWNYRGNRPLKAQIEDIFQQWSTYLPNAPLNCIDSIHIIGKPDLLCVMKGLRQTVLAPVLKQGVQWVASVYGAMQCMLKGVCAQCLQWQVDDNGNRTKAVFACSWQHQPFEKIDIGNIDQRLSQNQMQQTLSSMWLDLCEENTNENDCITSS